jgi:hypothetical protein
LNANSLHPAILKNFEAIKQRIADAGASLFEDSVLQELAADLNRLGLDEHEAETDDPRFCLGFRVDTLCRKYVQPNIASYCADVDLRRNTEQLTALQKEVKQAKQARKEKQNALWTAQQKEIVGDILFVKLEHPDGPVIWKVPAADSAFVKSCLPVFVKRLPPLAPQEAGELRRLKKKLRVNSWRLTKERRAELTNEIAAAESALSRAKTRPPALRYAIFTAINGKDVSVHRLYCCCDDDEQVASFDGDMTNFCKIKTKSVVARNFGLTPKQIADPKFMDRYEGKTIHNLYVVSSTDNPAHKRTQADFERDGIVTDAPEDYSIPIEPNADLGKRTQVFGQIQDCGKFWPLAPYETVCTDEPASRKREVGEALAALFGEG